MTASCAPHFWDLALRMWATDTIFRKVKVPPLATLHDLGLRKALVSI